MVGKSPAVLLLTHINSQHPLFSQVHVHDKVKRLGSYRIVGGLKQ